jgi:hypothetical protein
LDKNIHIRQSPSFIIAYRVVHALQ